MVEYTVVVRPWVQHQKNKERKEEKRKREGSIWFWRKCRDPNLFYFMICIGPNKIPKPKGLKNEQHQVSHPRVKVAKLACEAIAVGDLYMLVGARVYHHVPGIAVQPVCPVVVTLGRQSRPRQLDVSQPNLILQQGRAKDPALPHPPQSTPTQHVK